MNKIAFHKFKFRFYVIFVSIHKTRKFLIDYTFSFLIGFLLIIIEYFFVRDIVSPLWLLAIDL